MSKFENQLSRRYMGEDGWMLFCRSCGKHLPEDNFYTKKGNRFDKASTCKLHFNHKDKDDDGSMDYLRLGPITEDDFRGVKDVLMKLGYTFDSDESIHTQFMKKHNLKKD